MWRKSEEGPAKIQEGQFADSEAKQFTAEDIRFAVNNGCIYAIRLNMNGRDNVCIKAIAETRNMHRPDFSGISRDVEALGYEKDSAWTRDEEGLKINAVTVDNVVFKITVD